MLCLFNFYFFNPIWAKKILTCFFFVRVSFPFITNNNFLIDMAKAFETLVRNVQVELQAIFHRKADRNPGRRTMTEATDIPWYK
jgi:hypothetical protein